MNYYEELGVAQTASVAEIHHAYKALVRILHPDQQQDDKLRRLSELQLLRLNQIVRILSDEAQRLDYDRTLFSPSQLIVQADPDSRPEVPRLKMKGVRLRLDRSFKLSMFVWPLIVAILAVSFLFWFREPVPGALKASDHADDGFLPESSSPGNQPSQNTLVPVFTAPAQASIKTDVRQAIKAKEAESPVQNISARARTLMDATHIPRRSSGSNANSDPTPPVRLDSAAEPSRAMLATIAPSDSPKPREINEPVPIVTKPDLSPLSGKWLYAQRTESGGQGMFPPQYIEMQITSRGGTVRGNYYAKYRVTDPNLSPEVRFHFEGRANEASNVIPWSSAYGNKGEVKLTRISEEAIEVTWVTTVFARGDILASGKARLYRTDNP